MCVGGVAGGWSQWLGRFMGRERGREKERLSLLKVVEGLPRYFIFIVKIFSAHGGQGQFLQSARHSKVKGMWLGG